MRTIEFLMQRQSLPIEAKIIMAQRRIREWVECFDIDNSYVSFSGGKDSTVLLHIARQIYPNIKAIFCNTGLEYPELVRFAKAQENVQIIRPKMNFKDVIIKYGYPFISKEVAETVSQAKKNHITGKYCYRIEKLNGTAKDKNGNLSQYNMPKYKPLLDVKFNISQQCCDVMKKKPFRPYKNAILGLTAEESNLRKQLWVKSGCNAFDNKKPTSNPLMVWTEQDILGYIKQYSLKIASIYGEVSDSECGKLKCTGVQRTGCIFCGFGCHLDTRKGGVSRFILLKSSHPKLYDYCMRGGEFVNGLWQPSNDGLGMAYPIDELNRLYGKTWKSGKIKKFIEY